MTKPQSRLIMLKPVESYIAVLKIVVKKKTIWWRRPAQNAGLPVPFNRRVGSLSYRLDHASIVIGCGNKTSKARELTIKSHRHVNTMKALEEGLA